MNKLIRLINIKEKTMSAKMYQREAEGEIIQISWSLILRLKKVLVQLKKVLILLLITMLRNRYIVNHKLMKMKTICFKVIKGNTITSLVLIKINHKKRLERINLLVPTNPLILVKWCLLILLLKLRMI